MGAADQYTRPRRLYQVRLALLALRVLCLPLWGLTARSLAFQGLTPLATNLGSSGARTRNAHNIGNADNADNTHDHMIRKVFPPPWPKIAV